MSKLKIAGIIIAVMAASVFVFLYFVRPHTVINAILMKLKTGTLTETIQSAAIA